MAAGGTVKADSFAGGGDTMGWLADNAGQDYCTIAPWPVDWGHPFGDAMVNLDNQTDMIDSYMPTCGTQTDLIGIRWSSAQMGSDTRGTYECTKFLFAGTCDQGEVTVNVDLLPDYQQRRKTFCHEIGHSVGLQHNTYPGYSDCMVSGPVSGDSWWIRYSTHHRDHINAAY